MMLSRDSILQTMDATANQALYAASGGTVPLSPTMQRIVIEPYVASHLGVNSYDLRLDKRLLVYRRPDEGWQPFAVMPHPLLLDMKGQNATEEFEIPEKGIVLYPGVLYLGETMEYTETFNLVPEVHGRSSVGRLGLSVHVTAGFGDHGFSGRWTLELTVVHRLRVYAGARIAQICYHEMTPCSSHYQGKYANQNGPVASRMHLDFQEKETA